MSGTLPRLSRIELFVCRGDAMVHALAGAIVSADPAVPRTEAHHAVVAWSRLLLDVPNGGFTQFFYNHRGEQGVERLAALLEQLGAPKPAELLRRALEVYGLHRAKFDTPNPWDGLFGSIMAFPALDQAFLKAGLEKATTALEGWAREHLASLVVGDDGERLEVTFTGTVETRHPNGQLAQSLEVKQGKAHGAWREFFDDGTVSQVRFFKSGAPTGDYWPTGQLKRKESKRGALKVIEWFYPSGAVHKRMVLAKGNAHAEPIRRYHESGQLAEELTVRPDDEPGPWRKYFEDGTLALEGEATEHSVVIHDAWDSERRHVVQAGSGTFDDDGRRITPTSAVFFESGWRQVSELRGGKKHGRCTTYHEGVLWSVSTYVDGVQHGTSTLYWDNSRVRTVTEVEHGKERSRQDFPKFDAPVPTVRLTVRADEALYASWQHRPVDVFPLVQNLEAVRAELTVPAFLREVTERNRAGALKSDYESWNTFNDGIAYVLQVDETGRVLKAQPSGSGVYSGGEWNTYLPLLERLRFMPGRLRGRAIPCRVLARVDHTFAEATEGQG